MTLLICSTVIVWVLSLWCVLSVLHHSRFHHRMQHLLRALFFGGIGSVLVIVLTFSHILHAFSGEALVARITTHRLSPEEFELTYASATGAPIEAIHLRGDQWSISGGIVKWHPWLTALGLPSYHKPTWLSGQFSDLEKQRARPPTLYLLEPEGDPFWRQLYWIAPYLPFIEATYGSSAYAYVEPGIVQEIYVTASGYLIKRASPRRQPVAASRSSSSVPAF